MQAALIPILFLLVTLYLKDDRDCDPNAAESHEEEAANHQRPSAQMLNGKTLQNTHKGARSSVIG